MEISNNTYLVILYFIRNVNIHNRFTTSSLSSFSSTKLTKHQQRYIIIIPIIIFKKFGEEYIINKGTLMTILQVSRMIFEPCPLRLQHQALTIKFSFKDDKDYALGREKGTII
jgi:hypothetical protein